LYVLKDIHAPLSITGAFFLCHSTQHSSEHTTFL